MRLSLVPDLAPRPDLPSEVRRASSDLAANRLDFGRLDRAALVAFRRAAHLDPQDPDYPYILGEALTDLGRHGDALQAYSEAVRLHPTEPLYLTARAGALHRLGRLDEAETAYREALALGPRSVAAWNGLGVVLVERDRPAEGAQIFRTALEIEPAAAARNNLGVALWAQGDRESALGVLDEAGRAEPTRPVFHRNLALALKDLDRSEEALAVFRQLVDMEPRSAEALADLGDALYAVGRTEDAEGAYRDALALDPQVLRGRRTTNANREAMVLRRVREDITPRRDPAESAVRLAWSTVYAAGRLVSTTFGAASRVFGRAGALAVVLVLVAGGRVAWVTVPPYVTSHIVRDEMAAAARAPVQSDRDVLERLARSLRRRGLDRAFPPDRFSIVTEPRFRSISIDYEVPLSYVPGFERRWRFRLEVEEPYLLAEETLHF